MTRKALPNRRTAIAAIDTAAAATLIQPRRSEAADRGLAAAADHAGRSYGCAVRIDQLQAQPDFRAAVLREAAFLVPEIELTWKALEPDDGQMSFAQLDELSTFAAVHGKKLRGHSLLWHLGVPDWVADRLTDHPDWSLISRYFGSVIPRYGDVIAQWDVVNEPIDPGKRHDGLRQSVFLNAFGPGYIAQALSQARLFAPRAQLFINEYGLEYDNSEERDRRYLLLKLLDTLVRGGAPLDGVGLQAHLDLRKGRISPSAVDGFVRDVTSLGLSIAVTELDVKESDYIAPMRRRDQLVADEVRRYLDVVLSHPHVNGVATWGLTDRHSWLEVTSDDYARFPNAWKQGDGPGLNRGLPLDSSLHPKAMYFALSDALQRTPNVAIDFAPPAGR